MIGEGPGVPDSSEWKKKRLAESSVFSVGQKNTSRSHFNDLGVHSEVHFWINFHEKTYFVPGVFFL